MIQPLASASVPDSLDETGRVAADHSTWFHVPGNHGPGGHDSAVAHGDARKQDGARAHPHIIAQPHRLRHHAAAAFDIHVVIEGGDDDIVPDEASVPDEDAALVLELAATVDEHVLAEMDVPAAVGVKRREQGEPFGNRAPRQLLHERLQLVGRVVAAVDLHADADGFLAIAQEGSFTKAAERLHMTQPPLSRQMRDLEAELGIALFDRGGKGVTLTEEGVRFKERAQEVVDLVGQIESDMASEASNILGEVRIACGESDAVAFLAKAAKGLQLSHPGITYRLLSGDGDFVADRLDRGAADIGLLVTSSIDSADYGFMKVPAKDTWGVLMAEDRHRLSPQTFERGEIEVASEPGVHNAEHYHPWP